MISFAFLIEDNDLKSKIGTNHVVSMVTNPKLHKMDVKERKVLVHMLALEIVKPEVYILFCSYHVN